MNLRLREEQQAALRVRAEREGRSVHAVVLQAIDRYLEETGDQDLIQKIGATYATRHADLLRRLGE